MMAFGKVLMWICRHQKEKEKKTREFSYGRGQKRP
jgi:hypothetical protein